MFDEAYQIELSICVAEIEREKIWNKILSAPSLRPSMILYLELCRCCSMIDYAEILLGTHGV